MEVNNSFRALTARRPARPNQLARGNYAENVLRAPLVTGLDSALQTADITDRIALVLFTQDVPVALWAQITTPADTAVDGVDQPAYSFIDAGVYLVPSFPAGVFTDLSILGGVDGSTGASVEPGEMAIVGLATAGISVRGYVARYVPTDRGLVAERDAPINSVKINVIAESGVYAGEPEYVDLNGSDVDYAPVILDSVLYTDEIRQAGNVYVDTLTNTPRRVVGVYELSTPTP